MVGGARYSGHTGLERMMEMFSKELRELDQNTVQYMIDQMQEEIDRQKELLEETQAENRRLRERLKQMEGTEES